MRFCSFAAISFALVLPTSIVKGQPPASNAAASGNAALQYWQGFALLPTLEKDEEKKTDDWKTTPLDESARKITGASQSSLMYLHRAATASYFHIWRRPDRWRVWRRWTRDRNSKKATLRRRWKTWSP